MASATLGQLGPRFGIGTNVSAYVRSSNWPGGNLSGPPSGAAAAGPVAVANDGTVTFTGLAPETEYVIYAGTPDRYTTFVTGAGGVSPGARDVEVIGAVDTELPAAAALGDADANPTAPMVGAVLMGLNGATLIRLRSSSSGQLQVAPSGAINVVGDGSVSGSIFATGQMAWNGAASDRVRIANIFKSLASTALTAGTGLTIWTPAAGKKFRVLGMALSSSAAGQLLLGDNLVGTVIARSPALAAGGIWQLGLDDMKNGILSALANNVLKLDGPTGNVAGMVWGTEE